MRFVRKPSRDAQDCPDCLRAVVPKQRVHVLEHRAGPPALPRPSMWSAVRVGSCSGPVVSLRPVEDSDTAESPEGD